MTKRDLENALSGISLELENIAHPVTLFCEDMSVMQAKVIRDGCNKALELIKLTDRLLDNVSESAEIKN